MQTRTPSPLFEAFRSAFVGGQHLAELRAAGLNAVGVDLSSGMLQIARNRGPVVQGDLRQPPIAVGALDAIWSSAALLHVPMPDVAATLHRWHGLLKPGGVLGLSTSLGGQQGWEKVPYATPTPVRGELHRWFVHHDLAELRQLLREAGFRIDEETAHETKRHWVLIHATA